MKRTLHLEEDIFDFSLAGISCHAKDYRLTWAINKATHLELEKSEPVFITDDQDSNGFSCSSFSDEENHLQFVLINNKNGEGILISDHPQLDYVLKVSGPQHEIELEDLKQQIANIPAVLAIVKLKPENLKSKMNLVF